MAKLKDSYIIFTSKRVEPHVLTTLTVLPFVTSSKLLENDNGGMVHIIYTLNLSVTMERQPGVTEEPLLTDKQQIFSTPLEAFELYHSLKV